MSEETQPQSLAGQLAQEAARQAAQQLAQKALIKVGAVLGAKVSVVIALIALAIILVMLLVVLIAAMVGAPAQSSTAVWPVPIATDSAGAYQASGWAISSRFGWRDNPQGGAAEFHDGLDLINRQGRCPFGYHCGAPTIFDGTVEYVGWDQATSGDPSQTGGGQIVIVSNGQEDHKVLYAHLEPYRLYVQIQGRIDDDYGRYDSYNDYGPIGQGELQPDLTNGGIEMTCRNDMPNFIPTRTGPGTVVFLYDRPADCTTTVVWGRRGEDWQGWIADDPAGRRGDGQRADLHWQTPIESGKWAKDVALRFRAHLVPPPPPPTEVPTDTLTPTSLAATPTAVPQAYRGRQMTGKGVVAVGGPGGSDIVPTSAASQVQRGKPRICTPLAGGLVRCTWSFANIPTDRERFAAQPNPWVVAAHNAVPVLPVAPVGDEHDEALVASPTASVEVPTAGTPTPTLPHATPASQPARIGGLAPRAQAPTVGSRATDPASLTPAERQWVASGTITRWTFSLGVNTRGFWQVSILFDPPQLNVALNAGGIPIDCERSSGRLTCRDIPGSTAQMQLVVMVPSGSDGLLGDATATVADTDAQGAGIVAMSAHALLGVGTARTPTPLPPIITPLPTITPGDGQDGEPDCAPLVLVRLPNVTAPNPKLVEPAAVSFAMVRAEILERTGIDALAVLADVLRQPSFTTNKPGVLNASWHKAGRAVDLNQGGPFVRVAEGRRFRLYVNNVDVTAIFEMHGWRRIPVQGDTLEWWHYEWHPDEIAWTSAMLQVWDLPTLRAAFPTIDWGSIGCADGSNSGIDDPTINPQEREYMCALGSPDYRSAVEAFDGCGPPLRAGDKVYQLDTLLGFVGLTGRTTGPHLHLGLKVKSYAGNWSYINICTADWLEGRTPSADTGCYTDMVDPLDFLPRASGNTIAAGSDPAQQSSGVQSGGATPTPIIPEGAPYQLPPPNYPNSLVFTPVPDATPVGQYWSPYADGGRYGGGGVAEWFCSIWSGWSWCK